jgi:hypothetical protein
MKNILSYGAGVCSTGMLLYMIENNPKEINKEMRKQKIYGDCIEHLPNIKGVNIDKYKLEGRRKDSAIRSFVNPKLGLYIFNSAFKSIQQELVT